MLFTKPGADVAMLIASIQSPCQIPDEIDVVELRLDLNPDLRHFKSDKPLIIKSQLTSDAQLGHYFDGDWQADLPEHPRIICSRHMDHTPNDLLGVFAELEKARPNAYIYKLATTAHSTLDSLRMLIATRALLAEGKRIIGLCMGALGQLTRIASSTTYVHLGTPTASGQLSFEELSIYKRKSMPWYGLIGDPVAQSHSHITHNRHCFFVKLQVRKEELAEFFRLAEQLPFAGFAITIPHKEYFGEPINTLVRAENGWDKHNTDGCGALNVLGPVAGKRIALLGAGGAGKAIAEKAQREGAQVTIYNRTPGKVLGVPTKPLSKLEPYDILINATSCGMLSSDCPLRFEQLRPSTVVMETICTPEETTLLKYAKLKNCQLIYGKEMFQAQAALQFKLWQLV